MTNPGKLTVAQIREKLKRDIHDYDIKNGALGRLIFDLHIDPVDYYSKYNTMISAVLPYYSFFDYKKIKERAEKIMENRRKCKRKFLNCLEKEYNNII